MLRLNFGLYGGGLGSRSISGTFRCSCRNGTFRRLLGAACGDQCKLPPRRFPKLPMKYVASFPNRSLLRHLREGAQLQRNLLDFVLHGSQMLAAGGMKGTESYPP
uniref:Uncharacterized protein n=1 Tax=Arundo donax TaxID=35708 RepID=A0A0A9GUD8_ARUDO